MPGLPEYVRVFTAIELDRGIRDRIDRAAHRLLDGLGKASITRRENLHVTLKFVGDVHRDDLPALSDAVSDACHRLRPGQVRVTGFGAFPRLARPRVIWVGVSDPEDILGPVFQQLDRNLAEFGAKRERKRFVPHVTVGRVRGPFDADGLVERIEEGERPEFGAQAVRAATLFMSEISRGGPPRYTVMGRCGPD